MAVNKNFVVKNGLEVNTNLILADAATDKVGIGTTVPGYTLDVAGGIGATSVYAAGFSTFIGDVKIGSAQTTLTSIGNSVGVGTDAPSFLLDVRSAVSTGSTSLYVKGDARITGNLDVTGDISYDEVTGRNLYITGLSTFVGLSSAQDVRVGAALSVVGVSSFHNDVNLIGSAGVTTAFFDTSANSLKFYDGAKAQFGNSQDISIYHDGTHNFIEATTAGQDLKISNNGNFIVLTSDGDNVIRGVKDGAVDIYYNGSKRLETTGIGVTILGSVGIRTNLEVAGVSTFTGNIDANGHTDLTTVTVSGASTFTGAMDANSSLDIAGALDVHGHSEIDDINVSGASTFAGAADFNGAVDIDGHTELDDVNVSGMATFGSANIVAAGGTFQVGAGGTVLYVDTDGTLTIGSATTLATVSLNGGSIPSIGLVIALGG